MRFLKNLDDCGEISEGTGAIFEDLSEVFRGGNWRPLRYSEINKGNHFRAMMSLNNVGMF